MDSIKKEHLDVRICDITFGATNPETFREFMATSEKEFGLEHRNLDDLSDEELNSYLDFLDELWNK